MSMWELISLRPAGGPMRGWWAGGGRGGAAGRQRAQVASPSRALFCSSTSLHGEWEGPVGEHMGHAHLWPSAGQLPAQPPPLSTAAAADSHPQPTGPTRRPGRPASGPPAGPPAAGSDAWLCKGLQGGAGRRRQAVGGKGGQLWRWCGGAKARCGMRLAGPNCAHCAVWRPKTRRRSPHLAAESRRGGERVQVAPASAGPINAGEAAKGIQSARGCAG